MRHERLIVAVGVAALSLLSWLFVLGGAGMDANLMGAMRSPPFGVLLIMWWVMMAAMMLPSAAPAILLYGRVREMQNRQSGISGSWLFLIGYLAVWLLFSLAAASAQSLLIRPPMTLAGSRSAGAMLLVAGLYQLSPLKAACVRQCRSPAQFISRHWRAGWRGAVRLGILHGGYCVGCCWMLMALLFVGGVMNLLWIAGLTAVIAVEKLAPRGMLLGQAAGVAMIAWGSTKLLGY